MNEESRPKAALETPAKVSNRTVPTDDLGRRRDAAVRLPALSCGHSDPMDHQRIRTLKPLRVYRRVMARHSLVRGHIPPLLEGTSIRALWSHADRGWLVRTDRLPDVLVLAERDGGYDVRVVEDVAA